MKQSHQSVALAGLLAVVLAISGCASTRGAGAPSSGTSGASGSTGTYDAATGTGTGADAAGIVTASAVTSGSSVSSGLQDDRGNRAATSPPATPVPNSTVLAIEILPATVGVSEGDSSMGTSGTTGTAGSSGAGQAYRVTVRMDDGSTQVVTHNTTPGFRSGDRINVTSGAIRR
ncbi:hypothetical protein AB2N08_19370 [Massilia aurea]|uniref:hypothetical protein n=1 Tax=Massilia aurea TaxID=373040 RepID=UPI0034634483